MEAHHLFPGGLIEEHLARFVALAKYAHLAGLVAFVEVAPSQIAEFRAAQAPAVQERENRMVARVRFQCQQSRNGGLAHNPLGELILYPGKLERGSDIEWQIARFDPEGVRRFERGHRPGPARRFERSQALLEALEV